MAVDWLDASRFADTHGYHIDSGREMWPWRDWVIKAFNDNMWFAGGGIKPGFTLGETDDYSYNAISDPTPIHDVQATILHCLGIDHTRLTYKFQGRHFRLTDVAGNVTKRILA